MVAVGEEELELLVLLVGEEDAVGEEEAALELVVLCVGDEDAVGEEDAVGDVDEGLEVFVTR